MSMRKITQYTGDVVMFLLNKIIKNNKNKKLNYPQKNVGHANHVQGLLKTHGFIVHGLGGPYKWF